MKTKNQLGDLDFQNLVDASFKIDIFFIVIENEH